jgi:hypothetical protein
VLWRGLCGTEGIKTPLGLRATKPAPRHKTKQKGMDMALAHGVFGHTSGPFLER